MRQLQPSPNTNKQGVLLRAVLFLIALHVAWTVGCAWIEVHSTSGGRGGPLGAPHRSALRARAEWLLKYEERQDDEQNDSGAAAATVIAKSTEDEPQREADGASISTKWSFDS